MARKQIVSVVAFSGPSVKGLGEEVAAALGLECCSDGVIISPTPSTALEAAKLARTRSATIISVSIVTAEFSSEVGARARNLAVSITPGVIGVCRATEAILGPTLTADEWFRRLGPTKTADGTIERLYLWERMDVQTPLPLLAAEHRADHLPAPHGSFVGRGRELQALRELVEERFLVTITGPGGVGKSVLAMGVARAVESHFPDGIYWISLENCHSLEEAAQAIARETAAVSPRGVALIGRLAYALARSRALIVLDNADRILPDLRDLCDPLVSESGALSILVTAQRAMGSRKEVVFELGGLSRCAEHDEFTGEIQTVSEAVALFAERAQSANPQFTLTPSTAPQVHEICEALEGIPLAIELAAARLRRWSLKRIRENLPVALQGENTLPPYRRFLSWTLETVEAKDFEFLLKLCYFEGAFSESMVREVWAESGLTEVDVGVALERLVEQSLVTVYPQTCCYRVVSVVRMEARLRVEGQAPDRNLREQFAAGILRSLRLATNESAAEAIGADGRYLNAVLGLEIALKDGHKSLVEPLVDLIAPLMMRRPDGAIGEPVLRQAANGALEAPLLRYRIHTVLGGFDLARYDYARATKHYELALAAAKEEGSDVALGVSTTNLALVEYLKLPNLAKLKNFALGLAKLRQAGDPHRLGRGLQNYAYVLLRQAASRNRRQSRASLIRQAEEASLEAMQMAVALNDDYLQQAAQHGIAEAAFLREDWAEAEQRFAKVIEICEAQQLRHEMPHALERLALIAYERGQSAKAAKLLGLSVKLRVDDGRVRNPHLDAHVSELASKLRRELSREGFDQRMEEGAETNPLAFITGI